MQMKNWYGAAGICINDQGKILMVKQGLPEEEKRWSIPSGEIETNETYEACCMREISEETGYDVQIVKALFIKESVEQGIDVKVHYFEVEVIGGMPVIQDPDHLIYEIGWKSTNEIKQLSLSFEGDRAFLLNFIHEKMKGVQR